MCKSLAEFRRPQTTEESEICFFRRHVRRKKHCSGRKCGIWPKWPNYARSGLHPFEHVLARAREPVDFVDRLKRPTAEAVGRSFGANYSSISMTTPEPTVRPPSRIAKRRPFSMAMGVISSTFMSTLSPGMHISVPSGRVMTPVTSVVRK